MFSMLKENVTNNQNKYDGSNKLLWMCGHCPQSSLLLHRTRLLLLYSTVDQLTTSNRRTAVEEESRQSQMWFFFVHIYRTLCQCCTAYHLGPTCFYVLLVSFILALRTVVSLRSRFIFDIVDLKLQFWSIRFLNCLWKVLEIKSLWLHKRKCSIGTVSLIINKVLHVISASSRASLKVGSHRLKKS